MNRQKIIISLLFLSVLLSASHCCRANNKPSIAIIDFFPFGYTTENGEVVGMFVDIAKVISREMDVEFDIQLLPVPRALRDVNNGEIDLLISYKDPLMVPNVEFLGKVGCLTSLLVPSHNTTISSLHQLTGLRVGYITGGYFDKRYAKQLDIVAIEVPSNEAMLTMLVRKRLDAIVINDAVLNAYLHGLNKRIKLHDGWQELIGLGFAVDTMETHLSISNNSSFQRLKPKLKKIIRKTFNSGGFQDIYKNYMSGKNIECLEKVE